MLDIVYCINDFGVFSVECVILVLDVVIVMGVVDEERVGFYGYFWGGYQMFFLIMQFDKFKVVVVGVLLMNMISMYSLIYWNLGNVNQGIFESSQGCFMGGYWIDL